MFEEYVTQHKIKEIRAHMGRNHVDVRLDRETCELPIPQDAASFAL